MKQQATNSILKINNRPNFQKQVAYGQLEKPLATATLKLDIGENTFAYHFVVMKYMAGAFVLLHFMGHNSVVIDTTSGLIDFPHLTTLVKSAASEASAKPESVLSDDRQTIPPRTTKTITAFIDHPSEWKTTGESLLCRNSRKQQVC